MGDGEAVAGTSLKIYVHLLKSGRPMGVRELQRELGMKSPGTVKYHLDKLIRLGLVVRTEGKYAAVKPGSKSIYSLYSVFMGALVPRMLFYSVFLTVSMVVYVLLSPPRDYGLLILLSLSLTILWVESIRLYRVGKARHE